jgi:predicted RNA methylase
MSSRNDGTNMAPNRPPRYGDSDQGVPEKYFLGQMISLHHHFHLLNDRARLTAFREAIDFVVRPGAKVVELGGGTGVLSFFAAEHAEKVWCVERNPELVRAAEAFLARNRHGDRVEVVLADAHEYLPPEPVDVVVCEMLHSGLLREKQASVIRAFRENHARRFAGRVPFFVPEVTLLGFQAVEQSFQFAGYQAPIPLFQPPGSEQEDTTGLSEPVIYETIDYRGIDFHDRIPAELAWGGHLTITRPGRLNALRFATKNLLVLIEKQGRAVEWSNMHLVMPLPRPILVEPGRVLEISFSYPPGGSLDSLRQSIRVAEAGGASRREAA